MIEHTILQSTEMHVRENVPTSRKPDEKYFDHVFGARKYALMLADEYEADMFIIDMAIMLHDIGADAGPTHAQKSTEMAKVYLDSLIIDKDIANQIVRCIETHSMGSEVESLNQQIIQDADGLIFIEDSYKYFFEKSKGMYQTTNEAVKNSILKTRGMTAKIRTVRGQALVDELLPTAIEWLKSQI